MVDVYCPVCGAVLPFSVFAKQVAIQNRKHDRNLFLKIISERKSITTGELARQYQLRSGKVCSLRQVWNIVKELKNEGKVETSILNRGRYGRSTLVKRKKGKHC